MDWRAQEALAEAHRVRAPLSSDEAALVSSLTSGDYAQAPHRLAELFGRGDISRTVLALSLPEVWRYKLDNCTLPITVWRDMFLAAPYTKNYHFADRPRRWRRLYRGAIYLNRHGLSWTTNLGIAAHFAHSRQTPGTRGQVFTTTAPPHCQLARIRHEDEYIVNAHDLDIRTVDVQAWRARQAARLPSWRPPTRTLTINT